MSRRMVSRLAAVDRIELRNACRAPIVRIIDPVREQSQTDRARARTWTQFHDAAHFGRPALRERHDSADCP